MNQELLETLYDHRDICAAVDKHDLPQALDLWSKKAALLKQEGHSERSAMLEALSQSLYLHILQMRGTALGECRHQSREMYNRALSQPALVAHGKEIIRQYMQAMREEQTGSSHIQMACFYIDTHLSEPFTLETVAKHVFVSKCYLCRMFRNEIGQSFSQYVTNQRLDRAEHLLRNSDLPIDRIAEQYGFGSAAYFATSFRRRNGIAPTVFRRQLKHQGGTAAT